MDILLASPLTELHKRQARKIKLKLSLIYSSMFDGRLVLEADTRGFPLSLINFVTGFESCFRLHHLYQVCELQLEVFYLCI